jgi:biopolymer transport protein ExbB
MNSSPFDSRVVKNCAVGKRGSRFGVVALLTAALLIGFSFMTADGLLFAQPEQENDTVGAPPPASAGPNSDADIVNTPVEKSSGSLIPKDPMGLVLAIGWYFVVPFVGASIIAVWFSIERLVVLRWGRVIPGPFVERFLQHLRQGRLERDEALKLCDENGSPMAAIFAHGVRKWGKPSVEVEQAIIDGGERQVNQLRRHLRVLNGVATVTPLIGLLGTVIGMITSFNDIADSNAMGNAQQLAGGIGVALLTTAAGLLIAIPTLIMFMYLIGRVDSLVMEMDLLAQDVVQLISAEALVDQPVPVTHAPSRRTPTTQPSTASKSKRAV